MLGFLVKFVVATIVWLGCFEPHLIVPLELLPVSAVLDALHAGDYLLWIFAFGVIEAADRALTWYGRRNAKPAPTVRMPEVSVGRKRGLKRTYLLQKRGMRR